ncbi:DUF6615 family protein [Micromonospora sp. NPDC005171]|uniref:DUF6615 family protein n=1 Tax=Micromonospora sp. NPDC005171 TaxID=3156866 RepID=UPI0033A9BBC1
MTVVQRVDESNAAGSWLCGHHGLVDPAEQLLDAWWFAECVIERSSLRHIGTNEDVKHLVGILNDLAAQTWYKMSVGPSRGLAFGEESLTDHNLFELDRRGAPIEVYKFDKTEEPYNGADFEWWIGSDNTRWLGLRFQAKRLDDDGIYAQLGHRVRGRRQYELLLEQAQRDNIWAFYCFYNGWHGSWPEGVPNAGCRNRSKPAVPVPHGNEQKGCVHAYLEDFGCAIAPASAVARRHQGEPRNGRRALEEHLRYSRPWSHLFGDRKKDLGLPSQIVRELPAQLSDWARTASDVEGDGRFESGLPEGQGLHQELPTWLQARRAGAMSREGYRPAVAVVFNVSWRS